MTTAAQVRARIASLILGEDPVAVTLGEVTLQPHQVSAVSRIRAAIREFGGALLCDEVGMGKTFVAAAIAREYSVPLVVAPGSIFPMWKEALAASTIRAAFVSFEKLSRRPPGQLAPSTTPAGRPVDRQFDLVIVDEAHHARNQATRTHARLRELTRNAAVLLLSATPIHNRRDEMSAVLSLFLGSRAGVLTPAEISRCVLRREHAQIECHELIPRILPITAFNVADDPLVVRDLMSLPDPVPVRNGGSGGVLIGRGLVHQWASSEAALHAAIHRRIARAWALVASLEAGTYPTERELRAWTFDDGALQLGFPELISAKVGDTSALLDSVRDHAAALDVLRARYAGGSSLDVDRLKYMMEIRRSHPGAKIVAFSQYAPTVSMLYRQLRDVGGVAMLTSQGARVAGGKLSRREALARFAPGASRASRPPPSEAIDLLLATDLLSEGVNLQDAEVVVHLDLPWTAARLEQRVGRVARMGSLHAEIQPYLIRPPASAEAVLGTECLIARKWNCARRVVGSSASPPLEKSRIAEESARPASVTQLTESLRVILEGWRRPESAAAPASLPLQTRMMVTASQPIPNEDAIAAAVESSRPGFLAAVTVGEETRLVVCIGRDASTDVESQIAACSLASGNTAEVSNEDMARTEAKVRRWAEIESASMMAGISFSKALRRRRLVNRIDKAIESSPPHARSSRLTLAARARAVVASQQSAAIEAQLASLAHSELEDEEWLQTIAHVCPDDRPITQDIGSRKCRIRALLLLSAVQ